MNGQQTLNGAKQNETPIRLNNGTVALAIQNRRRTSASIDMAKPWA
jgi:hypothetical protein